MNRLTLTDLARTKPMEPIVEREIQIRAYPRNMYEPGFDAYKHHIATYGTQDKFGYKDFIPRFKAEHFDPSAWAELFKKAGANTLCRSQNITMVLPCAIAG